MHLFYTNHIHESKALLSEEESMHCVRVLRHQVGDEIAVTDGAGGYYVARISNIKNKLCEAEIVSAEEPQFSSDTFLHLVVAATKNMERMEWLAEKATEIGLLEFSPVFCDHSERRVFKTERVQKVMIAAMKQSFRKFLPVLHEPLELRTFLSNGFTGKKFIAMQGATKPLKDALPKSEIVQVIIGPEGDFSEEEINFAKEKGYEPVSLSHFRLRTETAAMVAVQTVQQINL